jgi:transposase
MSTYSQKLRDPRWQVRRVQVLNRDNFTCCDCGKKDGPMHVHHHYYAKGGPWETDESFLSSLCPSCHALRHKLEARIQAAIGRIMQRVSNEQWDEEGGGGSSLTRLVDSIESAVEKVQCGDCEIYTHADLVDAFEAGLRRGAKK